MCAYFIHFLIIKKHFSFVIYGFVKKKKIFIKLFEVSYPLIYLLWRALIHLGASISPAYLDSLCGFSSPTREVQTSASPTSSSSTSEVTLRCFWNSPELLYSLFRVSRVCIEAFFWCLGVIHTRYPDHLSYLLFICGGAGTLLWRQTSTVCCTENVILGPFFLQTLWYWTCPWLHLEKRAASSHLEQIQLPTSKGAQTLCGDGIAHNHILSTSCAHVNWLNKYLLHMQRQRGPVFQNRYCSFQNTSSETNWTLFSSTPAWTLLGSLNDKEFILSFFISTCWAIKLHM